VEVPLIFSKHRWVHSMGQVDGKGQLIRLKQRSTNGQ